MKLSTCIIIGLILAVALPMAFGGRGGVWMASDFGVGTIRPFDHSPGLLISVPALLFTTFGLKMLFSWHN
ncbi:hypothetical protein [Sphingomicrobium arenosum]|uniref:hypothetical protein n=1 Tax=Sphingomicrobium arenosum TaxID=2233861 RepID=UPI00223EAD5A|nr:hypothetical protein [Sphingomicrobium arenosum]